MRRAREWTRAAAAACGAVAVAVSLGACTSGGPHADAGTSSAPLLTDSSSASTHGPAVRWWSNGVASAGSTIDPKNPAEDATKLSPSRAQYCQMLSETLKFGKSVLSGVTANDPALAESAIAFVTELQSVAPSEVAEAWRALSPALLTLVRSKGSAPTVSKADAQATLSATKTIATDAKKNCGLVLGAG